MNFNLKKLALEGLFILSLGGWAAQVVAEYSTETHKLYAGQYTEVGEVTIATDSVTQLITVSYEMTQSGWCLAGTHLYVGTTAPTSGAPGQFPYQHANLGCTQSDYYEVPVTAPIESYYVAAHAEVTHWSLPLGGHVDAMAFRNAQTNSYFTVNLNIFGTTEAYPAWCVDLDRTIHLNQNYLGCTLFSTLDAQAPVDKPENLELVNYILNMDYSDLGVTKNEIQGAIWTLTDNIAVSSPPGRGGITWNQNLVDTIIADAYLNGIGFVPGPGNVTGVIVKCGNTTQVFMIVIGFDNFMLGGETAWLKNGLPFLNQKGNPTGWGTYFLYDPFP